MKAQRCIQYSLILGAFLFQVFGCRGWTSSEPPFHVNPNMDLQPKYRPFKESEWFADKRDMRPLVPGVIPRGKLKKDEYFYTGKENGELGKHFPSGITVDEAFIKRGQERFNIYCAPCHDQSGFGGGLVGQRMTIKPASLHQEYLYALPHGHFFDVITNGIRTMPKLDSVVSEKDRWHIVAYIRALQISQDADREWAWKQ